jgi:hypothetical protein
MSKRRYEIPLHTKVEIISEGNNYNGRIGTLGAKDPDGLLAHKVVFGNGEFDIFMDDEFIPLQNIITIDDLEYETLKQVFNTHCFYETDIIVVRQRYFSFDEIERAYVKHCNDLASWANGTYEIKEEEDYDTEHREDILGLLGRMFENNDGGANAIGETIMWEQWWIEGLRNYCTKGSIRSRSRYFNPEAKIQTIFI